MTIVTLPSAQARLHQTWQNSRNHPRRPSPAGEFPELSSSVSFASTWYAVRDAWRLRECRRVAPISPSLSLPASALNQGSFPPPALPDFVSTTSLSATPPCPVCPSPASGWSSARPHDWASRVARAFLVYVLSPLPRRSDWDLASLFLPSPISLPRYGCRVGLRIVLFEACSAFTHVTARTLALSPIRDTLYPKASTISLPP